MPMLKFATGLGMMALTIIIHALFMVGGTKMERHVVAHPSVLHRIDSLLRVVPWLKLSQPIIFDPVAGPFLEKLVAAAAPRAIIFQYGALSLALTSLFSYPLPPAFGPRPVQQILG